MPRSWLLLNRPQTFSNMVRQEGSLKKLRVPLMQLPHRLLENSCK